MFVVVLSSNSEGRVIQTAKVDVRTVSEFVADEIAQFNAEKSGAELSHAVGAVIGGTLGNTARSTIERLPSEYFLVPGLGAQGATFGDIAG